MVLRIQKMCGGDYLQESKGAHGRAVSDDVKRKAQLYTHLKNQSSSFICLDIDDDVWSGEFTEQEKEEIQKAGGVDEFYKTLPLFLLTQLNKLDVKVSFRCVVKNYTLLTIFC